MIWLFYFDAAGATALTVGLLVKGACALLRTSRTPTIARSGGR